MVRASTCALHPRGYLYIGNIRGNVMNIKDKIVLITGGSSGIGKETAVHLSRLGAKVILVARSNDRLMQVQNAIKEITMEAPLIIQCDITIEEDVSRMAAIVRKKYNHVDVLINSAGIGRYRPSEMISNQEMRQHFEVNFLWDLLLHQGPAPLNEIAGRWIYPQCRLTIRQDRALCRCECLCRF